MAPTVPLQDTKFNLDIGGVAGFFGGDEVLSAMGTVHLYKGRKYLGWYNSPGSYTVAKRYGTLANSKFWNGLFPGADMDPIKFLGLDGEKGPGFLGAHSGTKMSSTGHMAHLLLRECEAVEKVVMSESEIGKKFIEDVKENVKIVTRKSKENVRPTYSVVIAQLPTLNQADHVPNLARQLDYWIAILPILASAGPAAACAYFRDWYCSSMILLGMFSSGVACLAAGRGTLRFTQPTPVEGSPPGDGVLHSANEFLILLGSEGSVGAFSLKLGGEPQNHIIGFSALLLVVQFLLQLLLIPQGTLFGQAMFLATSACSWMYNCYLSSIDKEEVQRDILMSNILRMKPQDLKKYEFTKRTTAVIFLLWILQPSDKEMLLDELLPNNTATWKAWKKDVLEQLGSNALPKSPPNVQKEENLLKSLHTLSDLAHTMYWNYKQSHNTAVMDPTNAQNA